MRWVDEGKGDLVISDVVMPDGNGGNYTSRVNGLDKYVDTYLAVAKALKAVVPDAAFGPSNMAGISGDVNAGAGGGGVGYIRMNTDTLLQDSASVISPSLESPCASIGGLN